MKWTDEHIDQLFRKAAKSQSEIPYQDAYWKEMEALLPVKKGRKKAVLIWSVAALVVLLIAGSLFRDKSAAGTQANLVVNSGENSQLATNQKDKQVTTVQSADKSAKMPVESKDEQMDSQPVQVAVSDEHDVFTQKKSDGFAGKSINDLSMNSDKLDLNVATEPTDVQQELTDYTLNTERAFHEEEALTMSKLPLAVDQQTAAPEFISAAGGNSAQKRLNRWYGELNAGISQAWIKPENGNNATFASLGLSAGKIMRLGMFDFQAGLGISYTRFDQMLISERTIVYGFGKQILENSYKFNSITSAQLPLMLSLQRGRHEFGAGLTMQMNLFSVVSHRKLMDGTQFYISKGYTGTDLFSNFGLMPSLSYGYAVNENLILGARAQIQLIKQVKSDRFLGESVANPVGIQFFIRHTFSFN